MELTSPGDRPKDRRSGRSLPPIADAPLWRSSRPARRRVRALDPIGASVRIGAPRLLVAAGPGHGSTVEPWGRVPPRGGDRWRLSSGRPPADRIGHPRHDRPGRRAAARRHGLPRARPWRAIEIVRVGCEGSIRHGGTPDRARSVARDAGGLLPPTICGRRLARGHLPRGRAVLPEGGLDLGSGSRWRRGWGRDVPHPLGPGRRGEEPRILLLILVIRGHSSSRERVSLEPQCICWSQHSRGSPGFH